MGSDCARRQMTGVRIFEFQIIRGLNWYVEQEFHTLCKSVWNGLISVGRVLN